jgi:urease accessory protein
MTRNVRTMALRIFVCWPVAVAGLILTSPASAHEQAGVGGGLVSGLLHPLTGMDHLIAMVAVGLWGAQLGAPAIWVLPITFPMVMALGGVLGVLRIALPMPELAIALSALVLGVAIAMRLRLPFVAAAAIVAVFAVFHGHAHGLELPHAVNPLAYGIGFVASTGLLHLSGIMIGTLTRWSAGELFVQSLGAVIALLGGYFLAQSLGAVA